ncbi:MAG: NAD(P)-dependent oxidoreductase [Acidobacteriota bacterium]
MRETQNTQTITVLGTGAMGSRMARRLVLEGHTVRVWNRSAELARSVEGARSFEDRREAADGADVVLSMLRSDEACRHVWLDEESGVLASLPQDTLILECSTTSVAYSREFAARVVAHGAAPLDAPLAGSRPQAEAGQLIFLLGGPNATVERAQPLLAAMGQSWHHVGDHGAGAALKLALNALFAAQVAQLAELVAFVAAHGVDRKVALETLTKTPVLSPAAAGAGSAMIAGQFAPAFPIDLVCKDLGLFEEAASSIETPLSATTQDVFENARAAGLAQDNITGVAQLYLKSTGA